jgi:hypothetical protein
MTTTSRIAASLIAATVLLIAPAGSGAQVPGQDSVTGSGTFQSGRSFTFDARSGPSGENPSGTVNFAGFAGPVLCLEVRDNFATIVTTPPPNVLDVTINVVDNADTGVPDMAWSAPTFATVPPLGACGGRARLVLTALVATGDIAVVDAAALPTSKEQCKNGGWRQYSVFKNQGDCVSFVATGGCNQPAGPPR